MSKNVSTIFYTVHQPFAKNVALEMSGITKCLYSPWFINGRDWTIDVIICVSFIVKFKSCHWDNRKICCIFPIWIKLRYKYSVWYYEEYLIRIENAIITMLSKNDWNIIFCIVLISCRLMYKPSTSKHLYNLIFAYGKWK